MYIWLIHSGINVMGSSNLPQSLRKKKEREKERERERERDRERDRDTERDFLI